MSDTNFYDGVRKARFVTREAVASATGLDVGTVQRVLDGSRNLPLALVESFAAAYGFQIVPVGMAVSDPAELAAVRTLAEGLLARSDELVLSEAEQQAMTLVAEGMLRALNAKVEGAGSASDLIEAMRSLSQRRLQTTLTPANASKAVAANNRRVKCSRKKGAR